jgi:Mg2+-importing ATPase
MLTKGAPEAVFAKCTQFESEGEIFPMEPILVGNLIEQVNDLSEDGFRVLAVATRKVDKRPAYSKADESELVLTGYLAFLDPPKDTAMKAIGVLGQHGVTVKVLTGDNDLVTRKVCRDVGINAETILLGSQVEGMSDPQLAGVVETTNVFARLSPAHKQRIVKALQLKGNVVGFMGDGINDAPALRAADVGISVDNAVDIAKESADVILLEKSLLVLEEGVLEGRKVFVNILKYIRMGASSNFGNMFSVIGASAWLPYLPMQPFPRCQFRQIMSGPSRSPSRAPGRSARSRNSSSSSGRSARFSTTPHISLCGLSSSATNWVSCRRRSWHRVFRTPAIPTRPTRPLCSAPAGLSNR